MEYNEWNNGLNIQSYYRIAWTDDSKMLIMQKNLKTFIHIHFAGDKQYSKSPSLKFFYFIEQASEPLARTITILLWLNLWFLLGCHK